MAFGDVVLFGSVQEKTSDTSFPDVTGSVSVTTDDSIVVVCATDDGGENVPSASDNLGNTYTRQYTFTLTGVMLTSTFVAPVTVAGTLTSVSFGAFSAAVTAKVAIAAIVRNARHDASNGTAPGAASNLCISATGTPVVVGKVLVGWHCWEGPNGDTVSVTNPSGATELAEQGTTGGGAASNLKMQAQYKLIASGDTEMSATKSGTARQDLGVFVRLVEYVAAAADDVMPYVGGGYFS